MTVTGVRRIVAIALLTAALLLGFATQVSAGGDKNRGDAGAGAVEQHQIDWNGYERRP